MSGVHNGAQQKLNEILERKIPYTKCVPHGLNLVIEHRCEATTLISKVYDVLENSTENALQLLNLSKTRWAARAEAVKAVWTNFDRRDCRSATNSGKLWRQSDEDKSFWPV